MTQEEIADRRGKNPRDPQATAPRRPRHQARTRRRGAWTVTVPDVFTLTGTPRAAR